MEPRANWSQTNKKLVWLQLFQLTWDSEERPGLRPVSDLDGEGPGAPIVKSPEYNTKWR